MSDHYLKINIEDEIQNNLELDEEFTPAEIDEIVERAKWLIAGDDSFWESLNSCISDAIFYYRHRRDIDE